MTRGYPIDGVLLNIIRSRTSVVTEHYHFEELGKQYQNVKKTWFRKFVQKVFSVFWKRVDCFFFQTFSFG
jgi:hypothetical protein